MLRVIVMMMVTMTMAITMMTTTMRTITTRITTTRTTVDETVKAKHEAATTVNAEFFHGEIVDANDDGSDNNNGCGDEVDDANDDNGANGKPKSEVSTAADAEFLSRQIPVHNVVMHPFVALPLVVTLMIKIMIMMTITIMIMMTLVTMMLTRLHIRRSQNCSVLM